MSYVLNLKLRNMEGALERVLGVVRFRGFALNNMMAHSNGDGSRLDVSLTVTGARNGSTLSRQMQRLFDVEHVEVISNIPKVKIG